MMDSPTKPNTAKPVGSSPTDVTQAFRATGAATAETTTLMKDSYSAAVKGAQAYNTKFIEFLAPTPKRPLNLSKSCRA